LKGTNADIAKDILAKSGLKILVASELKDGADAVATAIRGGK